MNTNDVLNKLIAEIKRQQSRLTVLSYTEQVDIRRDCALQNGVYDYILSIITSLQQEQPEADYNKFEKLFDEFCESNKGHHITPHDACMWFWELGINAKK